MQNEKYTQQFRISTVSIVQLAFGVLGNCQSNPPTQTGSTGNLITVLKLIGMAKENILAKDNREHCFPFG